MILTDSPHHHDSEDDGFETFLLGDDGTFPNNPGLRVILYRDVITFEAAEPAAAIERVFQEHGWNGVWRNGIFGYHHFHATAHEVLGVASGAVTVQLGGDEGPILELAPGDVVILPAGVAHKNIDSSEDFVVVGAYPPGQIWDVNTGGDDEHPRVDESIAAVPLPETDPVYGPEGPLVSLWRG
ncbi:MAG: cupin domain-containing protein [Chloroflexia bacterium]|nr:cupin domain-containing protein [Chloroflexia bacterium]